ncbi:hypothetical protein [Pelagibacterium montanilacus]|uniref:hypothetical protein n=1 Tax=Pelagibacterium montanilacus TaxID=2185280 RepID=UPI000F8D7339|nr:hypothetical protein [Pelagibacterium montanilacus]
MQRHTFEVPAGLHGIQFLLAEYGPLRTARNALRGAITRNTRDQAIVVRAGSTRTVIIDPIGKIVTKSAQGTEKHVTALTRQHDLLSMLEQADGIAPRILESDLTGNPASFAVEWVPIMPGARSNWRGCMHRLLTQDMQRAYDALARVRESDGGPVLWGPVHGDLKPLHIRQRADGSLCLIDWNTGMAPFMREVLNLVRTRPRERRWIDKVWDGELDRLPATFCLGLWPHFSALGSRFLGADEEDWLVPNLRAAAPNGLRWRRSAPAG